MQPRKITVRQNALYRIVYESALLAACVYVCVHVGRMHRAAKEAPRCLLFAIAVCPLAEVYSRNMLLKQRDIHVTKLENKENTISDSE